MCTAVTGVAGYYVHFCTLVCTSASNSVDATSENYCTSGRAVLKIAGSLGKTAA